MVPVLINMLKGVRRSFGQIGKEMADVISLCKFKKEKVEKEHAEARERTLNRLRAVYGDKVHLEDIEFFMSIDQMIEPDEDNPG